VSRARRWAAAAGLVLAAALTGAPAHAAPTASPSPQPCRGVTVAVDFNELGGGEQLGCAPHAGTAAQAFAAAGFDLEYQPDMQGFVCTVQGVPDDRDCTSGSSYWSLWWSPGGTGWTYATLGAKSLDVRPGDAIAFTWHQGKGKADPPALAPTGTPSATARTSAPAQRPTAHHSATGTWLAVGLGVVVVGAAAGVPLARRRRGR